ncbi:zinc-dependent alcohol dehydrogenase family protein [Acidocella sp. KAb 2-4]|uniref:zinc-dependent alcohol dehydrogenase family protein n=1 Tax=Acidocella sp. KAb 2-4 TaxID=2885158 RepID=UPI001D08F175|nr:zinc-dependent alcohol dehydrogenase family protein [Acidocella sp. KAb 2-4]MCB5944616.1 zinc-dependent alcohol dehydrogenase family protein [Acidocella sp. KAb 2-4]
MRAMTFERPGAPLRLRQCDAPEPEPGQILLHVCTCGVCRTDLHIVDGELPNPKPHVVPGHEIVGRVLAVGRGVERFAPGQRVGVPWLGWTCGVCAYCRAGRENLCELARFTGYQIDGGYAEQTVADARYCFPIPERFSDIEAAPLLCAGLIGYRTLRAGGDARRLGIYGFGAAAHIAAQVARYEGREVFAFTRPGDKAAQDFARSITGGWVGGSDELPPEPLDAALIFAPAGELVPAALRALAPGGTVVCGGIHMSEIPAFSYDILWKERSIRSVANLTRRDAEEFLPLAAKIPIVTMTRAYALEDANTALDDLRAGRLEGAAVLVMG